VDLHCDETDDPMSRHVETLAAETTRLGLGGRVVASHVTAMHSYDNYYATKLIPLIAESGMNIMPNPLINITLQGRSDTYPKRRGLTRVPELRAAGVNVAFGQDCTMDPWYSLGSADMLEVAHMGVHAVPMTSREAMAWAFDSVTLGGAKAMGLPDPTCAWAGLRRWCPASPRPDRGDPPEGDAAGRDPGGARAVPDPGAGGGAVA
jgi:cytosine deaminase